MSKQHSLLTEFIERGDFDPAEYMRRTRPELFSDSVDATESTLDRGYFEYHLETLTSRSQEHAFEKFARRLAEVEICPNLRPQTGPTGGGDSKTDSSTYPVSQELAERTYWSGAVQPTSENWAFAFSCKKDWKSKVKSDVHKIAELARRFDKVYFISNQFVRDKDRSESEQLLSDKYGFDVHILDRSWILSRVFDHRRQDIAFESLNLTGRMGSTRAIGPRDTARGQELDVLLDHLSRPTEYYPTDYLLSADYRRAAILSRGLEKPRHEVDGLFTRARQLAVAFGNTKQIINACYDHAWTSLWWYDDPLQVAAIYLVIEQHLSEIVDTEECALLSNLLTLLAGALRLGKISVDDARVSARLTAITEKLQDLASDSLRPNNALYAETTLWLTRLMRAWERRKYEPPNRLDDAGKALYQEMFPVIDESFEVVCNRVRDCLRRSSGMATYPLSSIVQDISTIGEFVDDIVPEYEELFNEASELVRQRSGDRAEGEMLLKRGQQLLVNDHHRESLLLLGKARSRLAKEESLEDSCRAALACCDAYLHMQLFWAARMEALLGAVLALRVTERGFVDPFLGLLAAKRMCWCELALGRVAPFLAWYEICLMSLSQLDPEVYRCDRLSEDLRQNELWLGCFFLNLEAGDARELRELVSVLQSLGMPMAHDALAYASGDSAEVASELAGLVGASVDEVHESFRRWREEMPEKGVMREMTGETRSHCCFRTTVMGIAFRVTSRNSFGPILFSENLLGVLEAILALARWEHLALIVDHIVFSVDESRSGENPPITEISGTDQSLTECHSHYELLFKPDMLRWMIESRGEMCGWLHQFMLRVIIDATMDPIEDLVAEIDHWGEEGTFDRALSASPTCVIVGALIGRDRYDLNYWYNRPDPSSIQ